MRLVLLGPPGAGKGTQAKGLARSLGVPAISTGDIFRRNVAEGTDLGRAAKAYMDAGEYVPDEVTNAMVADRLAEDDAREGFLLDGYPRTTDQVARLDDILAAIGAKVDAVVELAVPRDELLERLHRRALSDGRTDDTPEVIAHRLEVYEAQTAPLVDVYAGRDLLVRVDGLGDVEDVTQRMTEALRPSMDA